jgi:hypothetical protein
MTHRSLVLASIVLPTAMLAAQTERITVRMAPAPNQTIHLRTTQQMVMTIDAQMPAGSAVPGLSGPVTMTMAIDSTSAVGPTDSDGHYSAKMSIDHATSTIVMNGKPMPLPAMFDAAAKPVIVFSYDQDGKVIDVTVDGMLAGPAIDGIKQLMTRALQTIAPLTLSVGESVTIPTAVSLPLPGGAAPAGVTAETRYTLTAVTFDGADRIAHLTTHMTTAMGPGPDTPPPGSPGMNMTMTMTSDGTSDVNVDRGIVVHGDQQMTMAGSMRAGPGPMTIHGTISIVTDLVK